MHPFIMKMYYKPYVNLCIEWHGGIILKEHYPFINTPLPYDYDALEPYIDEKTMHLHHDRHLQTYIDNLNAALKDQPSLQCLTLEQLIRRAPRLPRDIAVPIHRNAGGVYNHRFYFEGMTPCAQMQPSGAIEYAILKCFGSLSALKEKLDAAAKSVFGSGYAWLVADRNCNLKITTTANQDTPLTMGYKPILNIDVWEHAYYLKHYNMRADYIDAWWNVADWEKAEERFVSC